MTPAGLLHSLSGDWQLSRDFGTFIGVDLGGGKGKKTAVACLRREPDGVRVEFVGVKDPQGKPFYDEQLLGFIRDHADGALLAVDAPLGLSVCLRCRLDRCVTLAQCTDPTVVWFKETGNSLIRGGGKGPAGGKPPTTPYTQRACEVLLHKEYGILPRETLGQGMGPLTARAHYLRRALEDQFDLNRNLIEVYPKATIHALFGAEAAKRYKREVRTWQIRASILEGLAPSLRFSIWREGVLENDHCFDAVIAAYTGYLWAKEGWTMPKEG